MAINVACPACGRQYNVKDEAAGKRFKCKDCEAVVEVPSAGAGDEFGVEDYGDPYGGESSAAGAAPPPARRKASSSGGAASSTAAARTKLPAIFMYVVCGMSIAGFILDLVFRIIGQGGPVPGFVPADQQAAFRGGNIGFMFFDALCVFREFFLIFAFSRMQVLSAFNIAYAGAVISVIPCLGSPCCVVGIPFGIWALVVLNDPSVKAAFR